MDKKKNFSADADHQGLISRSLHSIRTRYSLATAFFVLLSVAAFYACGRIVLVHLMREAEQQVEEIGYDISRLAYRQADRVRRANAQAAAEVAKAVAAGTEPEEILSARKEDGITLVIKLDAWGRFVSGATRIRGAESATPVEVQSVAPYSERFAAWASSLGGTENDESSVGIVQINGAAHYVFMHACPGGSVNVVVGASFDSSAFTGGVNEGFVGLDVRIVNRKADIKVGPLLKKEIAYGDGGHRNNFGISPMLSEAMNFYSGGFWSLGTSPFEAVFAIRDIAGNAVSMITVSLPSSLSTVTRSALGRLAFSVAFIGILLILPIFWFQSSVLLNPLTKMTKAIRELGENHESQDCPCLKWDGKDEFAVLAASVNKMLETMASKSVEIAHVEARHRALIAGVPDALAIFDRRGRLVSVTKQPEGTEPLVGFKPGETVQAEVFGAGAAADFSRAVESAFTRGTVAACHLEVQRREGDAPDAQRRHFEVRVARMDDVFALGIVRDVTDKVLEHKMRLAAESRALDGQKRESLTMFAAGIAHDVNNVLAVIQGTVDALSAENKDSQEAAVVRDAARRGAKMMRELVEFAGDSKVSLVRVSPNFLVRDVESILSHIVAKHVAVDFAPGENLPDVDADPNKFWKALMNLVKNAGEALGDRPGHIRLSTEQFEMTAAAAVKFVSEGALLPGPGVLFKVADDGPGIQQQFVSKLFDPYVSSKGVGRGLGLATVRSIVETHGGGIRVESEPGKGTTFSIFLPASRLAPSEEVAKKERLGPMPAEVLVIDDDEAVLKMQTLLLRTLGVKVHAAKSRADALAIVRRYAESLGAILLDAHIEGVDVVRLFQAFRTASPDIPIVLVSGTHQEEIQRLFPNSDYDAFLAKPFTVAELKTALSSLGGKGGAA